MPAATQPPAWISEPLYRLGAIGDRPADDDETRLQHRFLVWMGVFMSMGGLLWGGLAVLAQLGATAVIPFGYTAITAANFWVFARDKDFHRARQLQVTISLLLPFAFQTVLGGFAASGAVMLWAMLALLGSLTFSGPRESYRWMGLFLAFTVASGLSDPWARRTFDRGASDDLRTWMFVMSISAIVAIVFGLIVYVLGSRRADNEALRGANEHVSALVEVLEAHVQRAEQAEHEALKASLAKSQFLANMSHELRTPLNAIIGYTELLLDEGPQSEELGRIRDAGKLLLATINDILDLAKIEAGKMGVDEDVVVLSAMVQRVVQMVEPLARKNRTRILTEVREGELVSDPLKLTKILYNLAGNAAKFTQDGTITIRARRATDGVVLEVEDTGIGMTAEQLAKVREPFVQADNSTTRRFGGTGLGLHLVQQYAAILGGDLSLRSAPGVGTMATVRLPTERGRRAA